MARRSPLVLLAKWIVAPAALFGVGYFLIGPRIGAEGVKKLDQAAAEIERMVAARAAETEKTDPEKAEPEKTPRNSGPEVTAAPPKPAPRAPSGPDIEVSVDRETGRSAKTPERTETRRPRRSTSERSPRQKAEIPVPRATPQDDPPVEADPGGVGGIGGEPN